MLGRQSIRSKLSKYFIQFGLDLVHEIGSEKKRTLYSHSVSKPELIRLERCIDIAPESLPISHLLTVRPPFLNGCERKDRNHRGETT